jgi:hypothetical protein
MLGRILHRPPTRVRPLFGPTAAAGDSAARRLSSPGAGPESPQQSAGPESSQQLKAQITLLCQAYWVARRTELTTTTNTLLRPDEQNAMFCWFARPATTPRASQKLFTALGDLRLYDVAGRAGPLASQGDGSDTMETDDDDEEGFKQVIPADSKLSVQLAQSVHRDGTWWLAVTAVNGASVVGWVSERAWQVREANWGGLISVEWQSG